MPGTDPTPPVESEAAADALAVLRRIYLERATGVLALGPAGSAERLFFVSGELYLRPEHPLAPRAGKDGEERPVPAAAIAEVVVAAAADFEFQEGIAHISSDLVGPLPTASVIMEATVLGQDEFQLLKQLGGEERRFVATTGEESLQSLPDLDPHEAFFLSRLDQPVSVKELLRQTDLERPTALEKLCRLQAIDLIRPKELYREAEPQSFLTAELVQRFADRIREGLDRKPLAIDSGFHRERLGSLLRHLGEMTFYELLQVELSSTPEEIHDAYTELARIVHPSHAAELGLKGKEAGMQLLFERATEAYLTLSDHERSRQYLLEVGSLVAATTGKPSEEVRDREEKSLAEHNFRLAKSMALREEYHFAIELLNQAVRTDPKAEYYALLAECQGQNPSWARKAVFNYSMAIELSPEDPDLRCAHADLLAQTGNFARARDEYNKATELAPGHPGALRGLAGLKRGGPGGVARRPGVVRRSLDWLRRLAPGGRSG